MLAGAAAARTATLAPTLPSQAAAPPVGKQAPGFYRYKVGSHEVTVVTDGARAFPLVEGYVTNASVADVRKALEAAYLPSATVTHHYAPLVVNTGSKLIVIDTGSGPGAFKQTNGVLGQFPNNLAAAGIQAKDTRHINRCE
jgi:glyoxylase-like metal-dependent hydrolase (beta-lactamase superfamily II)